MSWSKRLFLNGFLLLFLGMGNSFALTNNENDPKPVPTITHSIFADHSLSICSGATVNFTTAAATYTWTIPSVSPGGSVNVSAQPVAQTSVNPTLINNTSSDAIVTYTVTPSTGAVFTLEVTVKPNPSVSVNSSSICAGFTTSVTATPGSGLSTSYNYVWTVPGGVADPGNVSTFTTTNAGTYSVIITDKVSNCSSVSGAGTVTITPANTAGAASSSPTLCINSALTSITHTTTRATGISNAGVSGGNGLPPGVIASWASNTITISGTPTSAGIFNYSIPLTGGCGNVNATGTITVTVANTASAASSTQTICVNTALTNITHSTTGATGISNAGVAGLNGLPAGVSASFGSNTITISGTPTVSGTYNYSIPLTGGCGSVNATGTITVTPANTAGAASSTQTLCINTALTNITHSTTGATGISNAGVSGGNGLPAGVSASWASNTITISGTPTASGTFNYSIPLTGGCGIVNATGTITVSAVNTAGAASSTPTLCINSPLTNITHATTGATGISNSGVSAANGLPAGVSAIWGSNTITISGTPSVSGTFNYSIPLTGGCGNVNATGTITVSVVNTVGAASSTQSLCINTALSNITHNTTGATGISNAGNSGANGLPTGVSATWASNQITISGTPTVSGTFNYSIPLTGGCGTVNATGTITVSAVNSAGAASSTPTLCIGSALTNITHTITGATGISNAGVSGANGLPTGVSASWASNTITISGTPTTAGTFSYSIPLTGGCGNVNATGTIIVTAANTAGAASTSPTLCINTALTSITHSTTGATGISGAGVSGGSGLPPGVSATWTSNTITISGTPTASGTYNYSILLSGGCGGGNATGTIMVSPNNTVGVASSTPTLCINTALTNITHSTTGGSGISNAGVSGANGLPTGVSAIWSSNAIIISGTPSVSGTFSYSIPLTGGCGSVNATGSITVTAANTAGAASSTPTLCINTALTNITHAVTGATGISSSGVSGANGLPPGISASWASNTITISGTPTASGTYNYSIPLTGGCGSVNATGTIVVTPANTASVPSTTPTLCINTALVNITHSTTGATGISNAGVSGGNGLPAGLSASWSSNTITITGTPSVSGTFNYSIPLSGGCGNVNATGTITVITSNSVGVPSTTPTLCINTALINITHSTVGATGIGVATGLPTGVTAAWSSNTIIISGTPSVAGTFNYTIPLTGGCGSVNATGTITVTAANTAGAASSSPTLCVNTALTNITHAVTGATGISSSGVSGANGLPPGVSASWAANLITISGTPTASGTFNYSIPLTGGCGSVNATGTITVTPANTSTAASTTPTLCINTALINITHTTTGATGIGVATGLPAGVSAAWSSNTITISGTPSAAGTYNYSIPLTGGCGTVNATGTITVITSNTAGVASSSPTLCINTALTNITHSTIGATGIGVAVGLPAGVSAVWSSNTITISGTPSAVGTYNYSIPLTGGCGSVNATGTIIVTVANTVGAASSSPTLCINTALTNITHSTTGATGISSAGISGGNGLPAGLSATWNANLITISGTPTVSGTFNYSIPLTGGCGGVNATGTIIVTAANTASVASATPTLCINTVLPSITHNTTGVTSITSSGLPPGVTATWASNVITINGTPTATGTFNYTIALFGGCGGGSATGTIIVNPVNTAGAASSSPTLCINTALTNITHSTTGATGIGSPTGLPTGVIATWASNAITISGTPIASGTFNYTIPLTGGCGNVNATGTITVTPANTVGAASSTPTLCINTALTNITHAITGATGIGVATGLPAGLSASWSSSAITISGTPTASGTFNYSIPLTGGCGSVNATGTITVTPATTTSVPSTTPTLCINTALINITHSTVGATGIGVATGLPTGVTAAWSSNTIIISGTPSVAGTFNYTIPLTGGCGSVNATGTITVTAANTAGAASSSPTLCVNTALTNITHAVTGATGISSSGVSGANGLPPGVSASWAANLITISGTPTASGTFNYSIPLTGGCGSVNATGTITVTPANTSTAASTTPTLCINTALINITHTTTGATGIGVATGLPAGVSAAWSSNTITISGTPSAAGTYNYSIPLTGGCGTVNATGTITVITSNTAGVASSSPTLCINTALTNITHSTIGATGIGVAVGLPAGVSAVWSSNTITISGTPSAVGTYNYSIPLTGGCGSVNATGTIIVTVANTVGAASSSPTLCINTALTNITHSTTGATGISSAGISGGNGLPAGLSATWNANLITISGTPTVSGTFNYSIPLTGGCGGVNATGTIIVTAANTASVASATPTLCINTVLPSITHNTTGVTSITSSGLPPGVTATWASNVITINGTPTATGTFNYTIALFGGCGGGSATGTIIVNPVNTAGAASSSPTLCINTALTNITHSTTGATGIGSPTGLPTGVIATWASNAITISGTPIASGTFNYTIPLTGGCGNVNATGTITVTPANTVGAASSTPTLCINTALTNITHAITGATGISNAAVTGANGLPPGVSASWSSNTITISGTPTAAGTFTYSIPLLGGCGNISATGTITVITSNSAAAASTSPTLCINTALINITHSTSGATGISNAGVAGANGLPAGVSAIWSANTITISGTPTALGTFSYSIPLSGGCGIADATGTITVIAANTASAASSTPTLCINTALTNITHTTTGATGIGLPTGLPAGVTASWVNNTITISGTPSAAGTFNYSIPLTGGCGSANATGTIIVTVANTTGAASSAPTLCINTALTNITHATTGATGILNSGVSGGNGLPTGVSASWASNIITISGTPTVSGTFNYSIPLSGGCGNVNATGTIIVSPLNTVGAASSSPISCINTALTNITHSTTGATGISNSGVLGANGLPAGVSATWASNNIIITGTPTAAGTYNYSILLTGGCGSVNATGTITVTLANTVGAASTNPTLCINTPLTNITHTITGATGISNAGISGANGLPPGVIANWASNSITISGTPTAAGTYNYSISLTGGCGSATATGTITVTPANTVTAASTTPTLCISTPLINITHTTAGATGISSAGVAGANGLPPGVIATWASNTITISGTPTALGIYSYTIPLSGGCGNANATGVITVTSANTASAASAAPTLCINTALSNITHTTTGATGISNAGVSGANGLPQGVTATWTSNTITISGTPTVSGTFNYSIPLTGGCGSVNATGTITVSATNTAGVASSTPTLCINTPLTSINHSTTGATGIGIAIGLPAGVIATWASNTITISGTPTASGTFNYSIPLTGGCGNVNATGVITVTLSNTAGAASSTPTLCINTALGTSVTHSTTGATGISNAGVSGANGLPAGMSATWAANIITINGTPTVSGTFNYSIPLTGGCGSVNATGSITVTTANTVGAASSTPLVCINTALTNITHSTTGATGIGNATGLPAGVTATWASNTITINGTPTAAGTFNYSIPLTGGCGNVNATGTITVGATPTLTSALTISPKCSNAAISYTATGTATSTFAWTRATLAGITEPGVSGIGANISEPGGLTNTTADPITVIYNITITNSTTGCSNSQNVSVVINPTPILTPATSQFSICSGNAFTYNAASSTTGATFGWARALVANISNAAGSSPTGVINEILTNTSTAPVDVTYRITTTANGCNNPQIIVVTVNPIPKLSSALNPAAICSATTFNYTNTSATAGTTFSWVRVTAAGITSNAQNLGTGSTISEILTNSTTSPIEVTYQVTLNANGCSNTELVKVTVNPSAILTSTLTPAAICSGSNFVYTATSATATTLFAWTRNATIGISQAGASGNVASINEALTNTTVSPIDVVYRITLTANACSNFQDVTVRVNPLPSLTSTLTPTAICSGANFVYTAASATAGVTYSWVREVVAGIDQARTTGTNPAISEVLTNSTTSQKSVVYQITMTANGCSKTENVTVLVNPTPTVTVGLSSSAICSGASSTVTATPGFGVNADYDFFWTVPTGVANPGNVASFTAVSAGTYLVSIKNKTTSCESVNASTTLTVNPLPTLNSSLTPPAICSAGNFLYAPTSATANVTFTWTRASVVGISPAGPTAGNNNVNEVLTNSLTNPLSVRYIYTLRNNTTNCTNTQNVDVIVNAKPVINSTLTPAAICSGTTFSYVPTSNQDSEVDFTWTRAVVAGISNAAVTTPRTGSPEEILVNTSLAAVTVSYVYTLTNRTTSCTSTATVTVSVKPVPFLTSKPSLSVCSVVSGSGNNVSYALNPSIAGATITWTRAQTSPSLTPLFGAGDATTSHLITESLTNNNANPVVAVYQVTLSNNSCSATENVNITVYPKPTLTSNIQRDPICSGSTFSYTPTSASDPNIVYTWTRRLNTHINGGTVASGSGSISEVLSNTNNSFPQETVIYDITLTNTVTGCTNTQSLTTWVNTSPIPIYTNPSPICSGTDFFVLPTGVADGTTYTWTAPTIAPLGAITGGSAQGVGLLYVGGIGQTLTNTTGLDATATYTVTPSTSSCPGSSFTITVTVKPAAATIALSSTITPPAICSGTYFTYDAYSTVVTPSYSWKRLYQSAIQEALTVGITNSVNEILTNSQNSQTSVQYAFTVTSNGCSNTEIVTVKVNPTPKLSTTTTPNAICSGMAFQYTPASAVTGATFNWSRKTKVGISNAESAGIGSINEILINTTSLPITVEYEYELNTAAVNCPNIQKVYVVVNPTPLLTSSINPPAQCSGSTFTYTPTASIGGSTFTWQRNAVYGVSNIGANGTYDSSIPGSAISPAEILVDTLTTSVNVPYTFTITKGTTGCSSTQVVTMVVNPVPVVGKITTSICSGSAFSAIPTKVPAGTVYTWPTPVNITTGAITGGYSQTSQTTIGQTLTNTTPSPAILQYTVTPSTNGCSGNPFIVEVTVNPKPNALASYTAPAICSGNTFVYTPPITQIGTTYSWNNPIITPSNSVTGTDAKTLQTTINSSVLTNLTTSPAVVEFDVTPTSNGCPGTTFKVSLTVNPVPTISTQLTTICSGGTFSVTPSLVPTGTTYVWDIPVQIPPGSIVGANAQYTPVTNISQTLTNTTFAQSVVQYLVTATSPTGNCVAPSKFLVNVTINPATELTSSLTPTAVCSKSLFSYTPTSNTPGTSFSWTRASKAGISNAAATGTGNPLETLINTTGAPISVDYIYTLSTAGNCIKVQTVTVVVNPTPVLSNASMVLSPICQGVAVNFSPTSTTTGAVFNWTREAITGISNLAATGTGNPGEILYNTTTSDITVYYKYRITADACSSDTIVSVVVKPVPVVASPQSKTICSGEAFVVSPTNVPVGTTYTWVLPTSNPPVVTGGSALSTQTSVSQVLTNTTTTPGILTYIVTPTANLCVGAPFTVSVTVNPIPPAVSNATLTICSGATFSYTPTGLPAGTTYSWNSPSVSPLGSVTGGNASTLQTAISQTLINTGTTQSTVVYTVTPRANDCDGNSFTVTVNVNPIARIVTQNKTICSGSTFLVTPSAVPTGTTYTWAEPVQLSAGAITGGLAKLTAAPDISQRLYNNTALDATLTYTVIPSSTTSGLACTGAAFLINVTVSPFPELTSSLSPPAICSNTIFSYTPVSNTNTVINYNWTRAIVPGISNGAGAGTGNPNETLINTTSTKQTVVYVYTFTTSGGCTNTQNVTVDVYPTPIFSSSTAITSICSGDVFTYSPQSNTIGSTTRWSRSIIPGIANAAESGTGNPNEKLINTTLANISVDYNYSMTANGCSSEQIITVIVKPVPVVLAKSATICSGATFIVEPTLVPAGTKYTWAQPVSFPLNILTGVTGAGSTGNLEVNISKTLGNSSPTLSGTATYSVTPSTDGCYGNPFDVVVKVNPIPVIANTTLPAVCSGTAFSFVPTGIPSTTVFSWGNPVITPTAGLSGGNAQVNQSTISQVLTMTNLVVNSAVYTVSPSAEGCSGNNFQLTVPVNPTPVVSNKELSVCSGVAFIVSPEPVPTGTTYTWVSPTQTPLGTISGSSSQPSGQNNFSQTLENTTNLPAQAAYVVIPKTATCIGLSFNINVIVNPGTSLSSSLTPPAICSNTLFSYTPTSSTLGTTFNWTRAAVAGINNASGSGTGNPSEKLLNTTALPISVVYAYTLSTGAACTKTQNVTVVVNPTPVLTSTTTIAAQCSGLVFNYSPTSSTPGAVFTWVRDIVPGISNAKGTGLGDPNEILANVSSSKVFVGYTYTIAANGCSSTQELSVAIKPLPTIAPQTNTSCSNETFVITPPNAPLGTVYSWSAPSSNPVLVIKGGTLGASQSTITQTLSNATLYPAVATYTITPIAELCQGNDFTLTATVNPIPSLRDTVLAPVCSGSPFVLTPTSVPTGILYSWGIPSANPSTGIQGTSAQQGQAQISQTLTITNNLANTVEYLVSPVAFGCTGTSFKVTVPVNPTPTVANQTRTICSGESFSVIPSPVPFGTQYTWTTPVIAPFGSLSGTSLQSSPQLSISQLLSNTTTLAAQAYYTVVPKVGTCIGSPFNITVVVNPATRLSSTSNPTAICSGDIFSYTPTSNTAGTKFQWTRSVVAGISNPSAIGTNNPNERLINITTAPIEVTYVYSLVTNSECNETQIVKVTVNPIPALTSLNNVPAICSGEVFSYFPTADITGTVFNWSRVVQASISNTAATGTSNPLERLVNTSNNLVIVEYNYTLTVNGCSSTQAVTVPVKPAPSISNQSIIACSNSPFTLPVIATPTGTEYKWSTPVYIPNGSLTGGTAETVYQPTFSQTLTSQTLVAATANYTITPRAGTCEGVPFKLAVTLRPLPVVANQTLTNICSGSTFSFVPDVAPTGTTYTWNNPISVPSNSLTGGSAQSVGQANITQTLSSTNNILNTATYVVTPSTGTCAGNTFNLTVSINPTPIISDIKDSTCSGTPITINPTPVPIGTKYSWNPPTVSPFGAVMGTSAQVSPSGNIILNLINSTNSPAKVFYTITPVAGTCVGAPFTLTVGVGVQMPVLNNQAAEICSGTAFNATPVNAPRGTTYTWALPSVTPANSVFGVSNEVQGKDSVKQVLTNLTLSNGVAVYKVTANNSGCVSNQFDATVTVLPLPRTIITGNSNVCKYPADTLTINFSGQSPWSFTYREDSKAPVTISGISQSPYLLRLPDAVANSMRRFSFTNVSNAGCVNKSDTSYFTQIIKPSPTGTIYSNRGNYLCNNVVDTLRIVSPDSPTFKWMLNGVLIPGATKDSLFASLPGRYNAILTNSVGCSDTLSSTYVLYKIVKPILKLAYNTYCVNTPMVLTNLTDTSSIGITNWLWDFGDGNIQTSFNSVNTFATGGNYHITLKATQLNCSATSVTLDTTVDIQVPIAGITMPSVSAYKSVITPISVRSIPSYKYRWTPSWGISNRDSASVNFSFATTQQYVVNLISPAGCVTHDSLLVRVFDDKLVDILVPKSFTPNADGVNDLLFPYLTGIKEFRYFKIFNRQNQLMFETKNYDAGWNGNLSGSPMPMGIYIWVAAGVGTDGKLVERKGQTLLLR